MTEQRQFNKGGGILRGRQKPSYYILVTTLVMVWAITRRIYAFPKFTGWVMKQKLKYGRWDNLGREEIRSAYLEARQKVFKIDDLEPLEGEADYKEAVTTKLNLDFLTDQKEIEKANELAESIRQDGLEGVEDNDGTEPFKLIM